MAAPIEINLYNNADEVEKTCRVSTVRFGFLKKALKLQAQLQEKDSDTMIDAVAEFLVAFFNDQFSVDDLMHKATPTEVFAAFKAITAQASMLAGPENFRSGQG
jgi:hypothetical protein